MDLIYTISGVLALGVIIGIVAHKYLPTSKVGVIAGKADVWAHAEVVKVEDFVKSAEPTLEADAKASAKVVLDTVATAVAASGDQGVEETLTTVAEALLSKGLAELMDTTAEDGLIAEATKTAKAVIDKALASKAAKASALAAHAATVSAAATKVA